MDRQTFDTQVAPVMPMLEGYVRRMIGHPEDTRDLVQDTLLAAYSKSATFRGFSRDKLARFGRKLTRTGFMRELWTG